MKLHAGAEEGERIPIRDGLCEISNFNVITLYVFQSN